MGYEEMYKTSKPPENASESNQRIFEPTGPPKRLYQVWKGGNKFLCGGRLVFGPDMRSLNITIFLIVTPVIFFCIFISKRLIHEFGHRLGDFIIVVAVLLTLYVLILLLLTSGRDPGIISRSLHPPEPDYASSNMSTDWLGNQTNVPTLAPTKDVIVNGKVVKIKYCQTCMLYRPPRCSHCSVCNNCVDRFDHHCPWVGQCIARRNYRFFFMFVSTTTVLCIYVFAFTWINILTIMKTYRCHVWNALLRSPVSSIIILYTFSAAWFVGGLTMFHLYLICTNQTTYENFRYRYSPKTNPYNLGIARNVWEIFCAVIPVSKNNFREIVKEDTFGMFNASLSSVNRGLSPDISKKGIDIETGDSKREAVGDDELQDMRNQMSLERCGPHPMHGNSLSGRPKNWEISPDLENSLTNRDRET